MGILCLLLLNNTELLTAIQPARKQASIFLKVAGGLWGGGVSSPSRIDNISIGFKLTSFAGFFSSCGVCKIFSTEKQSYGVGIIVSSKKLAASWNAISLEHVFVFLLGCFMNSIYN
jgi:hypothetical protein